MVSNNLNGLGAFETPALSPEADGREREWMDCQNNNG